MYISEDSNIKTGAALEKLLAEVIETQNHGKENLKLPLVLSL